MFVGGNKHKRLKIYEIEEFICNNVAEIFNSHIL
jgi:hypothetical protein